jgi:hypothetical protein
MKHKSLETTIRDVVVKEDHDEIDYEGQMAIAQLMALSRRAERIAQMLQGSSQLESWVQAKITKAEDYIGTVYDYLRNTPNSVQPSETRET